MASCLSPIWEKNSRIFVPCGRCINCLQRKRNEWSFRLNEELKRAVTANFVTLTYSDENLPVKYSEELDMKWHPLIKRDLQLFIKKVRKRNKELKIKYYAVGEYGEEMLRPHYHMIIFNVQDKKYFTESWDKGYIHIGQVTPGSIAYVTKYVITRKDPKQTIIPPSKEDGGELFSCSSKYLGFAYMEDNYDWHKKELRSYVINSSGKKQSLPRYYSKDIFNRKEKEKIANENFERVAEIEKDEIDRYDNYSMYFEDKWKGLQQKQEKVFKKVKSNLKINEYEYFSKLSSKEAKR